MDFEHSPFYVNKALSDWPTQDSPRRAGVSSFGIGGTNVHVVLEEGPEGEGRRQRRQKLGVRSQESGVRSQDTADQLLVLSARSEAALVVATANLAAYLERCAGQDLADIAYTLQMGRRGFAYRRSLVTPSIADAIAQLQTGGNTTHPTPGSSRPIAFLFPGQGSQHPGMVQQLYQQEPVFRQELERCAAILSGEGIDLLALIYGEGDQELGARSQESGANSKLKTLLPNSEFRTPNSEF
ncbi:MAG: ketoacyl-synthetase C-terminal extension domain-containing protein, partial [Cyanobacteria bacterium J06639_14]